MTDKQPFRDKLVLPTASINVFLTSLTHVGLANVGRLMVSSGHLPVNAGHGGGQALGGGWGAITGGGGTKGEIAKVEGINGWEVVGRRVAFKENFVRAWELTEEIEEGVLEYVKYLVQGGQPLYVKINDGGEAGGRYRITKTTKTRTRSRSRSRGPLGLGKESRSGQMYVMRKKSVSRPSTERIEIVERDYTSRPEGEGGHGKFLALPAPPAPEILNVRDERQPLYVERKPKESSSDGSDGGGSDSVGDSARIRRASAADRMQRRTSEMPETERERAVPRRAERPSARTHSEQELKSRSRYIRQRIAAEKERAVAEIEQTGTRLRTRSRIVHDETLTPEQRAHQANEEEIIDTMEFLDREYGVTVEPIEVPRDPIDNGRVKAVEPPSAASGFASRELSDSEESDTPIVPSMSRTDRLRAETSLPVHLRSRRDRSYMYKSRYEPYSRYDRDKSRRWRQSYHDEDQYPPLSPDIADHGYGPSMYPPPPPPRRNYHDHYSDDDSDELRRSKLNPNEHKPYMTRQTKKGDRKNSLMKPIISVAHDGPSNRLPRPASYGSPDARHEAEFRRREMRRLGTDHDQDDTYMRGALGPDNSDDGHEDRTRSARR